MTCTAVHCQHLVLSHLDCHNSRCIRYIQRRALDSFREHRSAEAAAQPALLAQARVDLDMVKRQAMVYGLFGAKVKNVLVRSFVVLGGTGSDGHHCMLRLTWTCIYKTLPKKGIWTTFTVFRCLRYRVRAFAWLSSLSNMRGGGHIGIAYCAIHLTSCPG